MHRAFASCLNPSNHIALCLCWGTHLVQVAWSESCRLSCSPERQEDVTCDAFHDKGSEGLWHSWVRDTQSQRRSPGLKKKSKGFSVLELWRAESPGTKAFVGIPLRGTGSGCVCVTVLGINGFMEGEMWDCRGKPGLEPVRKPGLAVGGVWGVKRGPGAAAGSHQWQWWWDQWQWGGGSVTDRESHQWSHWEVPLRVVCPQERILQSFCGY